MATGFEARAAIFPHAISKQGCVSNLSVRLLPLPRHPVRFSASILFAVAATVTGHRVAMDTAVAAASSLSELVETIPRPYQPVLRAYLVKKYRIARKRVNVRRALSSYQRHMGRGTFPSSIRNAIKVPLLRFADEFLETSECTSATVALHVEVLAARKNVLKRAICQKKTELAFLSTIVRADANTWKQLVINVAAGLAQAYGGSLIRDAQGCTYLSGMPPAADADFVAIRDRCLIYATRVLSLAQDGLRPVSQLRLGTSITCLAPQKEAVLTRVFGRSPQ